MKTLLFSFIAFLFVNLNYCYFENYGGPFYIRMKGVQRCEDPGLNPDFIRSRLLRKSRNELIVENNITLPFAIGNNVTIRFTFWNIGTNGHTWNVVFNKTDRLCDFLNIYMNDMVARIFKQSNITYSCPFKKGVYNLRYLLREPICNPFDMFPQLPYGHYRVQGATFIKRGSQFIRESCIYTYGEARPLNEIPGHCQ